jgi:hypothetical protein
MKLRSTPIRRRVRRVVVVVVVAAMIWALHQPQ